MGAPDAFARLRGALSEAVAGLDAAAQVVIVQPHDFPDHDAVAAAYGLARLLGRYGFRPRILHRGRIRSHSLTAMVAQLSIPMERVRLELDAGLELCPCIIVDGSPNNANAHPLTRNLLGVVDHHANPGSLDCPFSDIRTSYGACATIIADYWVEAELFPDRDTATALLMGIQMDTDFLSRRVTPSDLDAHHRLFFRADWQFGTRVVKASLSLQDLKAFGLAISNYHHRGNLFFTVLPLEGTPELISIIADFFLRLREISVTVIVEAGGERHHVSVRSRLPDVSAAAVIRLALVGIGEGGGHDHMAGGFIYVPQFPDENSLFERFADAVEAAQENQ